MEIPEHPLQTRSPARLRRSWLAENAPFGSALWQLLHCWTPSLPLEPPLEPPLVAAPCVDGTAVAAAGPGRRGPSASPPPSPSPSECAAEGRSERRSGREGWLARGEPLRSGQRSACARSVSRSAWCACSQRSVFAHGASRGVCVWCTRDGGWGVGVAGGGRSYGPRAVSERRGMVVVEDAC